MTQTDKVLNVRTVEDDPVVERMAELLVTPIALEGWLISQPVQEARLGLGVDAITTWLETASGYDVLEVGPDTIHVRDGERIVRVAVADWLTLLAHDIFAAYGAEPVTVQEVRQALSRSAKQFKY